MTAKRKAQKKKTFFNRAFSFVILFAILLVFSLKMYQMFTVDLLMKDLRTLGQKKEKLVSETARLQAEVNRLKNIDRIGKIASEKLGLINNTDKVYVLQLKDNDILEHLAQKEKNKEKMLQVAGVQ